MTKTKPKTKPKTVLKICKSCSTKNNEDATICKECGKEKFHPTWVEEHRKVNRAVSVDVTESAPFDKNKKPFKRITLNKFWPGITRQTFHINSPEHWELIKNFVDSELGPIIGWESKEGLVEQAKKIKGNGKSEPLNKLLGSYPQFSADLLRESINALKKADAEDLLGTLNELSNFGSDFDELYFASLKDLFKRLQSENTVSIASLSELLKDWNLRQITDTSREVKRRLKELELFIDKIRDEKTYEIKGENSIHRILERSMWLIDERYWIIQSNKQLRTFIGKEIEKENKKQSQLRPDFACGNTDANSIIIIEIKKPSHTLSVDDLDQLENYIIISKKYFKTKPKFTAILIGNTISDKLEDTLEFRKNTKIMTYNELVSDCQKRYTKFLEHAKKNT